MHKTRSVVIALVCATTTYLPLSASEAISASPPTCTAKSNSWPSLSIGSQAGPANPDVTLIAPHGNFDRNTKDLTLAIGKQMNANVVWATDSKATFARRINVNRPTEMRWGMERRTNTAQTIFTAFSNCVALHPSQMSVEIHGSSNSVVEMATVGVSIKQGAAMKEAWANRFGLPLAIDAAGDDLVMAAGADKRTGLLSQCAQMCLHLELPSHLRDLKALDGTAQQLASFLIAIKP
ncbi:MAG: hypothetical protein ACSLFB_08665 [Acidimicrobiales bacterium]